MHLPAHRTKTRPPFDNEAGYLLLGAVVLVAVVLITLAIAAPVIARDIQRDKEVESMHRAEQYVRAIQMFQRACKCQAYPPSMDALEKNATQRFLRQRYIDPLTGKSDWRLIHDPQTKIHPFFDKTFDDLPAGSLMGGSPNLGAGGQALAAGPTPSLGAGFANATNGPSGTSGPTGGTGTTGSTGSTGSSDAGIFGDSSGGPIKGVGTSRTGNSILNPNQQTTYETWEFWWDPRMELLYAKSKILGGGGIGTTTGTGVTSKDAVTGQPDTGTGSGNSNGNGSGNGNGTPGGNNGTPVLGSGFGPR